MLSTALVNGPFGDPAVYAELKHRGESFLFDLGDISSLSARKILKIRYIFVSHAHLDHFIGFDHLLRICLGRDRHISLFGPPGFLERVESKLKGYTWNLVENYTNDFELAVTEVHPTHQLIRRYRCRNAFRPEGEERRAYDGMLVREDAFSLRAVLLDHAIPCLAFIFEETAHLNIKKNALTELSLPTGPWLKGLKEQILRGETAETPVYVWWKAEDGTSRERLLPLGLLQEKIVKITPGKKVCYISDVAWNDKNATLMIELAKGAELLFIETCFLHEDAAIAASKHHLTAQQAGGLAATAGVKRLVPFHFSPKYKGREELLRQEVRDAFAGKNTLTRQG